MRPSRRLEWPKAVDGITKDWWKQWKAVWQEYKAWVAYRSFLEAADQLFVREDGMPDMRFRTPGDLVDNDVQTVRKVPVYLPSKMDKVWK